MRRPAFDDVTVEAGDLIVADEDGVVAIPVARVAEVIAAAQAREAREADQMRRIREGESTLAIFGWDQ
ncbi:regulator of RNase E activity RraA [Paraburkholderia youngii]|uniref:hypothetical protein n=1 Tax=Paraburkholderia youngii TaxID=2782701 RepID=UPI003D1AB894